MIKGDKEYIKSQILNTELIKQADKIKSKNLILDVFSPKVYKSRQQNRLFHSLLMCFWSSGCSSFKNMDRLRNHYKKIAGLIKTEKIEIEGFIAIKETHQSWSEVKNDDATTSVRQLMQDMDEANVLGSSQGSKYKKILEGLGEWFDGLN